jgi:CRISPR/Cas system CSM-associated protein Csm2 small subunit
MSDRVAPVGSTTSKPVEFTQKPSSPNAANMNPAALTLSAQIAAARSTQATTETTKPTDRNAVVGAGTEGGKSSLLAQRVFLGLAVSRKRERKRRLRKAFDHAFDRFSEEDDPLPQDRALFSALLDGGGKNRQYPLAILAKRLVIEFDMLCRRKAMTTSGSVPKNATALLSRWLRKNLKPLLRLLDILYYSEPGIAIEYAEGAESFMNEIVMAQTAVSQFSNSKPTNQNGMTRFYEAPQNAEQNRTSEAEKSAQDLVAECKTWPEFLARYSHIRARTLSILGHYPH